MIRLQQAEMLVNMINLVGTAKEGVILASAFGTSGEMANAREFLKDAQKVLDMFIQQITEVNNE